MSGLPTLARRSGLRPWLAGLALALAGSVPPAHGVEPPAGTTRPATESGVPWHDLKPAQQVALKPLERDWSGIDTSNKQKWLELAARFPAMSPEERSRVQGRMGDWAKLTPQQRGQARLHFQESSQVPKSDRQARWQAYQSLPAEQKRQLAARADLNNAAPAAEAARRGSLPPVPAGSRSDKGVHEAPQAKSNIVPNPSFAAPLRPVAPTLTQAQPGATTSLMSRRPAPPVHQQPGLPKIAATPEFVNRATLLPHRGPQGAGARAGAASESDTSRRR